MIYRFFWGPISPAKSYNFRRPDRVSKEQLRSLQFLHDRYAANVSTSLVTRATSAPFRSSLWSAMLRRWMCSKRRTRSP